MVYLSRIVILHSFVKLPDGRWVPLGVIGWKQASWCLRVTLWKPPWIPTTDTELQIQMMAKLWRFIRWLRRGESSTLNDPISAWWIAITLQNGTERWTTWHLVQDLGWKRHVSSRTTNTKLLVSGDWLECHNNRRGYSSHGCKSSQGFQVQ